MTEPRVPNDETATQAATQPGSSTWPRPRRDLRVHGLTILYHPDLSRVGERTVLDGLGGGRASELSRQVPRFAQPAPVADGIATAGRPLDDLRLSRTPIVLRKVAEGVAVERSQSPTSVTIEGRPVDDRVVVTEAELVDGVVVLLGGRIVLLLHLLDPVVESSPRFGLVGDSPAMARLRRDVLQTADLRVPVLLRGESGTGKELVARAIHDAGPRRGGPYVAVNMAALPSTLAAAELFGAERGAFTGADRRRSGHFEQADGGTLFLDEVGDTPFEVQPLLLRALETGEVQAVGGARSQQLDVRIVSATDLDLEAAIADDRFRAQLLHRLGGYVLRLPPLRQRREDFGRLLVHFLRRELDALGLGHLLAPRSRPWIPAPLIAGLAAWSWPGNVRQLANVVRQMVIANRASDPADHFEEVEKLLASEAPRATPATEPPRRQAAELREDDVVAALRAHQFRPAAAADALGIPRSSIYDLMKKIPGLRKASDLGPEEIEAARVRFGPSLEAMAQGLEVSERALRRRLGQLES